MMTGRRTADECAGVACRRHQRCDGVKRQHVWSYLIARRIIPLREFLQRFTPEERTAIRATSTVNPDFADWIDQARLAREIELDAPSTAAG